jgi:hypothetical protein
MSALGHELPRNLIRGAAALPAKAAAAIADRCVRYGPKGDILPSVMSGLLDLRAEPDLLVAAARLVRPRHCRLEGGPRREVFVLCVDVRPALP